MRFYSIEIRNAKTDELVRPKAWESLKLDATYTSYAEGQNLAGALNVELDIPTAPFNRPKQGASVRIWGVSWDEIAQSNDLTGCNITIYAGMKKGLPLAKPEQSRFPLIEGARIYQAFGNREGALQTLDLVIQPAAGLLEKPVNIVLNWEPNSTLAQALETTLSVAFKDFKRVIKISDNLKMASQQPANYKTLQGLASEIKVITQDKQFKGIKTLGGGVYEGVDIYIKGKTIYVTDNTKDVGKPTFGNPLTIAFEDLIGQPTWLQPNIINFKTVMRADLTLGDYIQLPPTLGAPFVITTPGAAYSGVPARSQSTFKGKFLVKEKHEFGNFRQADARSWVSSINATAIPQPVDTSGSASP